MNPAPAMPGGSSPGTTRHRLVISKFFVPKSDIVAAALTCCAGFKSAQHNIHNSLRSQNVSTYEKKITGNFLHRQHISNFN
jgi:hypothetical protein